MAEAEVLKQMAEDMAVIKEKIVRLEIFIDEIDQDLHKKINPEYAKKLRRIEKEDKTIRFKNIKEFDRHFRV